MAGEQCVWTWRSVKVPALGRIWEENRTNRGLWPASGNQNLPSWLQESLQSTLISPHHKPLTSALFSISQLDGKKQKLMYGELAMARPYCGFYRLCGSTSAPTLSPFSKSPPHAYVQRSIGNTSRKGSPGERWSVLEHQASQCQQLLILVRGH